MTSPPRIAVFSQSNIANHTEYVRALYLGYLQRFPDAPGLNWYAGLLNSQAVTREEVREEFAASVEFALRVQELYGNDQSDTARTDAFTTYVYNAALQRDPSTTERDTARNDLDLANAKGVNETVVAARALAVNLLSQNNYQQQRAAYDYVLDLYATFLRHPADEAGALYWKGQVNIQGRLAVLNAFAATPAFEEEARTLYREVLWLTGDHLGTPRLIAERTGKAEGVKRRDMLPFGEELLAGGRGATNGYTPVSPRQSFTTYERDEETGLDYAQARYYANGMGRFISVDPLLSSGKPKETQSWNRYTYVLNNPLVLVDPNGLMWVYQQVGSKYSWAWTDAKNAPKGWHTWTGGNRVRLAGGDLLVLGKRIATLYHKSQPEQTNSGELPSANQALVRETARQTASHDKVIVAFTIASASAGYGIGAGTAFAVGTAEATAIGEAVTIFRQVRGDFDDDSPPPGSTMMGSVQGQFSITDWNGYPEGTPRPTGPFTLLEGADYDAARSAANNENARIRRQNPSIGENNQEIHETIPSPILSEIEK